ncbi:hypothetical protein ACOME3_002248 [Neoechinorhynchus agilis]
MGVFLDKPVTIKKSVFSKFEGDAIFCTAEMQGWRTEMEDARIASWDKTYVTSNGPPFTYSFFAILDGHAGSSVSKYASDHFVDELENQVDQLGADRSSDGIMKALRNAIYALDEKIRDLPLPPVPPGGNPNERGGSTFVGCLLTRKLMYFINLGDSRGFLVRNGSVFFSTIDHKPVDDDEKRRIVAAGGQVILQRVNGSLAVSRALGDFDYKEDRQMEPRCQMVSSEADIKVIERRTGEDELVILACDGIFDVASNEAVMTFVVDGISNCPPNSECHVLRDTLHNLLDKCLNEGSRDNMSVLAIVFPTAFSKSSQPQSKNAAVSSEQEIDDFNGENQGFSEYHIVESSVVEQNKQNEEDQAKILADEEESDQNPPL